MGKNGELLGVEVSENGTLRVGGGGGGGAGEGGGDGGTAPSGKNG